MSSPGEAVTRESRSGRLSPHGFAHDLGYTRYSEIDDTLDQLDLIDADYAEIEGRGSSRALSLPSERGAIVGRLE